MLNVRLTPKAGRDEAVSLDFPPDGEAVLHAKVRAAPEKGRTNAVLEKLVAGLTGVAPSTVSVVRGQKSRHKTVHITGDPADLAFQVKAALREYENGQEETT